MKFHTIDLSAHVDNAEKPENLDYDVIRSAQISVPSVGQLDHHEGPITHNHRLTPANARAILALWEYHRQRPIREATIHLYLELMENGDWQRYTEMHVGIRPDGSPVLLNGYHRLTALSRLAPESTFTLPVTMSYSLVSDNDDIASYYAVIDTGTRRNQTDAIVARGLAEEWGVPIDVVRASASAAALILTDFTGGRSNSKYAAKGRSIPGRMRFVEDYEQEIKTLAMLVRPATSSHRKTILRSPVVAVALMTLRWQPEKAEEFWTSVVTGEALLVGMPAMTLRNYLSNNPMKGTLEHVYARYVANCWNAFYMDDVITKVQVRAEGVVDLIVIRGTPYTPSRRERERAKRLEAQHQRMAALRAIQAKNRGTNAPEEAKDDTEIPVV